MSGHSQAVLLLHGQPGGASDWEAVASGIPAEILTLAPDRPGWDGGSEAGDLRHNARAALAALDEAGVERATVVGHSFGGTVAAWLAVHHPERVGALVLVAPAANTASMVAFDRWLALPVAGDLTTAGLLALAGWALALEPTRRLIAGWAALDERAARRAGRLLRAPATWSAFTAEQRSLISQLPELERSLDAIRAPTTIVIGSADRIVPPGSAALLAEQIPGAKLVNISRASHLVPHQHPEALAELIVAATGYG